MSFKHKLKLSGLNTENQFTAIKTFIKQHYNFVNLHDLPRETTNYNIEKKKPGIAAVLLAKLTLLPIFGHTLSRATAILKYKIKSSHTAMKIINKFR